MQRGDAARRSLSTYCKNKYKSNSCMWLVFLYLCLDIKQEYDKLNNIGF